MSSEFLGNADVAMVLVVTRSLSLMRSITYVHHMSFLVYQHCTQCTADACVQVAVPVRALAVLSIRTCSTACREIDIGLKKPLHSTI